LNISSNGLHTGFNVQGIIIKEVQNAICESEMPRFLNIKDEAEAMATKGSPMAKYTEGTQNTGFLLLELIKLIEKKL
jgi:hypothetical protein